MVYQTEYLQVSVWSCPGFLSRQLFHGSYKDLFEYKLIGDLESPELSIHFSTVTSVLNFLCDLRPLNTVVYRNIDIHFTLKKLRYFWLNLYSLQDCHLDGKCVSEVGFFVFALSGGHSGRSTWWLKHASLTALVINFVDIALRKLHNRLDQSATICHLFR